MASRLTYGLAEHGLLPRRLATVLPGRRTPAVAIVAVTVAVILMLVSGGLTDLAETTVLLLLFVFIAIQLVVLKLGPSPRGDHCSTPRFVPAIEIVARCALLTQQPAGNWLHAAGVMAIGGLAYRFTRSTRRTRQHPDRSVAASSIPNSTSPG